MRLPTLWLIIAAILFAAGCGSRDDGEPPAASTSQSGDEPAAPSDASTGTSHDEPAPARPRAAVLHRIVLLDDSLSMAAQSQGRSAYDRGRAYLEDLAANHTDPQQAAGTLSVLRFSQARSGAWDVRVLPAARVSPERLARAVPTAASLTAAGPADALAACGALISEGKPDDRYTLYIISDFRRRDWAEAPTTQAALARLAQQSGVEIVLVPTTAGQEQNLAVAALTVPSIPTPGQPSRVNVRVDNFGPEAVARPPVNVFGQQQTGAELPHTTLSAPGVLERNSRIQLPYEFTLTDSAPVIVEAHLNTDDALAADNTRYLYFEVPEPLRVLIVDELAADAAPGRFVAAALSPLPEVATGFHAEQSGPSALEKPLEAYASVVVSNVPRLSAAAITNLRRYVEGGGVLVYFAGKDANARYLTSQLYDDGRGLLPFPVEAIATLAPPSANVAADEPNNRNEESQGDVRFEPGRRAFAVFTEEQFGGTFQQTLHVARYLKVPPTWKPGEGVQVLATLRDGSPLIVERQLGHGRAIFVLTAIDPAWTNWMNQPSWVLFNLELQNELHPLNVPSHILGQPLRVPLDGSQYQPRARWSKAWPKPDGNAPDVQILNARSGGIAEGRPLWVIDLNPSEPGVYELILEKLSGEVEGRYYAWNVDPAEGDLALVDPAELITLAPDKIRVEPIPSTGP